MSTLNTTNLKHPSSGSNNIVLASDGSATVPTLSSTSITGTTIQGTIQSGTAVASTSGTSIDFTGIPSWVKRITVMFNGVSTNGSSNYLVQIGSGSFTTSGYISTGNAYNQTNSTSGLNSTAGFAVVNGSGTYTFSGHMLLTTLGSNVWVQSHSMKSATNGVNSGGGDVTLSGTLDRIRITTVNGTDTFDAGTINILWEG